MLRPLARVSAPIEFEHVVAQQIVDGIWRVRDRNVPEHDALCVLGVIEATEDGYLTLFIGDGAKRLFTPTLDAAIREFAARPLTAAGGHNVNR